MDKVYYYDRSNKKVAEEEVPSEKLLRWLYNSSIGKLSLNLLIKRKFVSVFVGKFMNSKFSFKQIDKFIKRFDLDMTEYQIPQDGFKTFNEFFVRKIKSETRSIGEGIVSPADGKILAFSSIKDIDTFFVKGSKFNLSEFLKDDSLKTKYENCSMFIVRLAPADYHRFHFPADGVAYKTSAIKGKYYSVSPLALKSNLKIFCQNFRTISTLQNEMYGDILLSEVGATMVGSVYQTYQPETNVKKGDEKGYFAFGGSTIVMLFEKGKISIEKDLLENTKKGMETSIKMGEKIAQ